MRYVNCSAAALGLYAAVLAIFASQTIRAQEPVTVRTPTTPLVLHDPYFSVWSFNDELTDGPTRHWTGSPQRMAGFIRVDGKTFRFLGDYREISPLKQVSRTLWPTRTIYDFEGAGIHLSLTFFTPALPQDLDVLSRPVTYLSWDVRSSDGQPHTTSIYFDASAQLATNTGDDTVVWGRERVGDMQALRIARTRSRYWRNQAITCASTGAGSTWLFLRSPEQKPRQATTKLAKSSLKTDRFQPATISTCRARRNIIRLCLQSDLIWGASEVLRFRAGFCWRMTISGPSNTSIVVCVLTGVAMA